MADQFVRQDNGRRDCSDAQTWGQKSGRFDYIVKGVTGDTDYPSGACAPWVHGNAQIDNIQVNGVIISSWLDGQLATARALPAKPFDIPHPSREGHRLRHVSLEGPEIGVYYRGSLKGGNVIQIPDYWEGLIDPETITVNLTPVGSYQELFVEKIEWGKTIIVKNRECSAINCYYTVYAERKDLEKLIVEYEGETIHDYPGEDFIGIKKTEEIEG